MMDDIMISEVELLPPEVTDQCGWEQLDHEDNVEPVGKCQRLAKVSVVIAIAVPSFAIAFSEVRLCEAHADIFTALAEQ